MAESRICTADAAMLRDAQCNDAEIKAHLLLHDRGQCPTYGDDRVYEEYGRLVMAFGTGSRSFEGEAPVTPSERTAPVQVTQYRSEPPPSVPWAVHVRAWQAYAALGHGDQSAERIAERGGFSWKEMVLMLAECNPWADGRPMTEAQLERLARYRASGRES